MDWWAEERVAWAEGWQCLVGIDEAGRGALAGPVVAACVVLPRDNVPDGVADSKTLTHAQREALYGPIVRMARGVGVGVVTADRIDEINILRATHEAMRIALENLPYDLSPDLALIDGLPVVPFPIAQFALVRGDGRSASIAAASIVAKVTRDRLMIEYAAEYPDYGFAAHKGYGAASHLRALALHGPCPLHRRTYRPVAAVCRPDTASHGEPADAIPTESLSQTNRSRRRTHRPPSP